MVNFRNKHVARPVALLASMVVTVAMALVWGGAATSAAPSTATSERVVADTAQGSLDSRIFGSTANGRDVTGSFVPLKFSKRNGKVFVRGLVSGVVHNADGSTRTFGVLRTLRVKKINGERVSDLTASTLAQRAAACDVLTLVLGPLDLDLLGLVVHLDKVVLHIEAQPGSGNLLGNLLCAVAGLLDGGLEGLLGRLVDLLNDILGQLGLGL